VLMLMKPQKLTSFPVLPLTRRRGPLVVRGTRMLHASRLLRAVDVVSSCHARTTRRRPTHSARGWALLFAARARMASSACATEDAASLAARKQATRVAVKAALRALTPTDMASQSERIAQHLLSSLSCFHASSSAPPPTHRPRRLGLYVHCAKLREVDTTTLLTHALALANTEVYVPIVDMPRDATGEPNDAPPSMRFLLIKSLETDLEPKTMGIMEPTEFLEDGDGKTKRRPNLETPRVLDGPLDVLLMPGLGFEKTGARLGRGGGFYDAWLERYFKKCDDKSWVRPPTLALAYDAQILSPGTVPMSAFDQYVDALCTADAGVLVCTPEGKRALRGTDP